MIKYYSEENIEKFIKEIKIYYQITKQKYEQETYNQEDKENLEKQFKTLKDIETLSQNDMQKIINFGRILFNNRQQDNIYKYRKTVEENKNKEKMEKFSRIIDILEKINSEHIELKKIAKEKSSDKRYKYII